tara:strand:+ start:118 stop:642 length:525 start_codon:yes stop_codon:yes gene_type:complete
MEDQVEGQKKVQAIAALAGMVKSSAAELDENIISTSSALQPINSKWSPEELVKRELTATVPVAPPGQATSPPPPPPPGETAPVQAVPAIPVQTPVPQQPIAPAQQPMNLDLFAEINNRLKTIEDKVTTLESTYEKILGSMLKSKAKTITIKFDEAQNTKQDGVRKPVSKSSKQD